MDEIIFIMKKTAKAPYSTRLNKKQIGSRETPQESYSLCNCQHDVRLGRVERGKGKYNYISLQGWDRDFLLSEKTTLKSKKK